VTDHPRHVVAVTAVVFDGAGRVLLLVGKPVERVLKVILL
jgi:hypothetical protein